MWVLSRSVYIRPSICALPQLVTRAHSGSLTGPCARPASAERAPTTRHTLKQGRCHADLEFHIPVEVAPVIVVCVGDANAVVPTLAGQLIRCRAAHCARSVASENFPLHNMYV